jgi:DNA-binding beta-propeller fold protein YncE
MRHLAARRSLAFTIGVALITAAPAVVWCGELGGPSAGAALTPSSGLPTTRIGTQPIGEALDPATGTLYIANSGSNTLSMIDTRVCNIRHLSGCRRHWPTVPVGGTPLGVVVNDATHTVYATDFAVNRVTLFNNTTCNARVTTGCNRRKLTIHVGPGPDEGIIDPSTGVVYVADANSSSVSIINGNVCNAVRWACKGQPFATATAGGSAGAVKLNPKTHTVYVANGIDNTLSVINAATCIPSDPTGCTSIATINDSGVGPTELAVDPRTDTVYVTNTYDGTSQTHGTVSVVDAQTCNATDTAGCSTLVLPQVNVQTDSGEEGFDPATGFDWITNAKSNTVSIIDSRLCSAATISNCQALKPPTKFAGRYPTNVLADPHVSTVYVVDQNSNAVALLPER